VRLLISYHPLSAVSGKIPVMGLRPHEAKPDLVVGSIRQILLGAQVAFGRLNRRVPEQQLNLLQLSAGGAARSGTRPPKIVRIQVLQPELSSVLENLT